MNYVDPSGHNPSSSYASSYQPGQDGDNQISSSAASHGARNGGSGGGSSGEQPSEDLVERIIGRVYQAVYQALASADLGEDGYFSVGIGPMVMMMALDRSEDAGCVLKTATETLISTLLGMMSEMRYYDYLNMPSMGGFKWLVNFINSLSGKDWEYDFVSEYLNPESYYNGKVLIDELVAGAGEVLSSPLTTLSSVIAGFFGGGGSIGLKVTVAAAGSFGEAAAAIAAEGSVAIAGVSAGEIAVTVAGVGATGTDTPVCRK